MVASHAGWDINPRILGIVPKEAKIATLKGFHWIGDSHFMCVPKGLSPEKMAVMLRPDRLHAAAGATGAHL